MKLYPYRSNKQFETYISQFMRVFSGFQYNLGEGNLKRVPVVYGNMSRVVASILNKKDSFTNNQVPMMAVNMTSLEMNPEGKRSPRHIESIANIANQDPTTRMAVTRIIGPSFKMLMEVSIYAESNEEMFDIMEQILLVFNPRVTINVGKNATQGAYITEISLTGINSEVQYPMGMDKRVVMNTLTFDVPVRLNYPTDISEIINDISMNVTTTTPGSPDIENDIFGEEL
jgi:ribosomal protein L5